MKDLYDFKAEPEITCDGMGDLLANNTCEGFEGAQVKGMLSMSVADVGEFVKSPSAQEAVQTAIASLAGVKEKMDVTVTLSSHRPSVSATFRRLASGIAEADFSIEVPAEANVSTVGEILNSNTLAQMNAVFSRSW